MMIRLRDLAEQSERRHQHLESSFLNEEEQMAALAKYAPSDFVRYDGGYEGARKKKVIFDPEGGDGFSDIVCLSSPVDMRFRPIGHRDILGSLMSLQIDRHTFGDFWIQDSSIYLYTSASMGRFLIDQCTRIGAQEVTFHEISERPVQIFRTRRLELTAASERADALVAALASVSRSEAKQMIRSGLVQLDHAPLEEPDEVCNNNCTISIRGKGRFTYVQTLRRTRKDRIVAEFLQDL